jgi:crossover junction endodeoxyribonuclease RuvC
MRALGIDTSLRSTGVGVVESRGSGLKALNWLVIRNGQSLRVSECLRNLQHELQRLVSETRPDIAALEGSFYFKNARTAMVLGQARGVAISVCASAGIPVFEYAPRRVKQAVVGFGAASKEQVQAMVKRILSLDVEPPEDAADALALAICHLNARTPIEALAAEEI